VNVIVALAWPNHVHHRRAVEWFSEVRDAGWATCPTTESGFVRVSSNPRAIPDAKSPVEAIELLTQLRRMGDHHFWSDDTSLVDDQVGLFANLMGHRQVTDAHLLTLAIRRNGTLATFDRGIVELQRGFAAHVELIGGNQQA
jgi:uncharacterized protein